MAWDRQRRVLPCGLCGCIKCTVLQHGLGPSAPCFAMWPLWVHQVYSAPTWPGTVSAVFCHVASVGASSVQCSNTAWDRQRRVLPCGLCGCIKCTVLQHG